MNENNTSDPIISVIIPTYNRANHILKAIKSVIYQSCQKFEIIVVDDASSDETEYILDQYIQSGKIRYLKLKNNRGAQTARNLGIKLAKGKWIAFLDSDDEWLPNMLETCYRVAQKKQATVVYSECIKKTADKNEMTEFGIKPISGYIYKELLTNPGPMFQGLLVKKEALERIGLLDEKIISYQEWDTVIRLSEFYNFEFIKIPLFVYNIHSDTTISKDMRRDADGWCQIVEKHRDEIVSHAGRNILAQHYLILSNKYSSIGDIELGDKYMSLAFENFSRSYQWKFHILDLIGSNAISRWIYRKFSLLMKKLYAK